ncbi:MAG: hypothetical protein ACOYML_08935 [Microthrixaceae bacterium]
MTRLGDRAAPCPCGCGRRIDVLARGLADQAMRCRFGVRLIDVALVAAEEIGRTDAELVPLRTEGRALASAFLSLAHGSLQQRSPSTLEVRRWSDRIDALAGELMARQPARYVELLASLDPEGRRLVHRMAVGMRA